MRKRGLLFFCCLAVLALAVGCEKDSSRVLDPAAPISTHGSKLAVPVSQFLGDRVWNDANGNGLQDSTTTGPGVPGVTVELYTCTGTLVATDTTDANGFYGFVNPAPGSYKIHFVAPAGSAFTLQDQGADDQKDSDADATGWTSCISLAAGQLDLSWDAGLVPATGACCNPATGACTITTQANCAAPSTWQGVNASCSPNPCPQPQTGACCSRTGCCSVTTQGNCQGTWMGAGSSCNPSPRHRY